MNKLINKQTNRTQSHIPRFTYFSSVEKYLIFTPFSGNLIFGKSLENHVLLKKQLLSNKFSIVFYLVSKSKFVAQSE